MSDGAVVQAFLVADEDLRLCGIAGGPGQAVAWPDTGPLVFHGMPIITDRRMPWGLVAMGGHSTGIVVFDLRGPQ